MASLIDSSVLIEVERGRLDLAPFARARAAMAAITAAELLAGVAGLRPSYRKDRSAAQVEVMIAATALTRGMTVVTRDRRSFPRIPGLEVELLG